MAFRKKRKDPFKEIQSCLQKRDYKGALDWFNTLLKKDPKNTQIRLRFADTLVLAGDKNQAVKQLRIVADELADKGFMIRAIAINKKILQIDPRQTDVHDKLAAMTEERPTSSNRQSLAEALTRPGEPIVRRDEEPAPEEPAPVVAEAPPPEPAAPEPAAPAPVAAPAPPPTATAPEPPVAALPELSLEESMEMEFGSDTGALMPPELSPEPAAPEAPSAPPQEEPQAVSGGFDLMEDAGGPAASPLDEVPSFDEDPVVFDEGVPTPAEDDVIEIALDAEPSGDAEVELSFDGLETAASDSPEIVLDVEPSIEPEADIIEPSLDLGDDLEEGLEIVELEAEPEFAPDIAESLVGALGEDIDSLIDSIIDDVGQSAQGEQDAEDEAPTHIPLFSDLTTAEFVDVALLLVRRVAKAGEVIVTEGAPGDSMFIISTGEVRATVNKDGQPLPVATLRDGNFFGEMAALSGEPRTATVTSVKNTELLELTRDHLREICSRHPHVEAKIRLSYDERVSNSG